MTDQKPTTPEALSPEEIAEEQARRVEVCVNCRNDWPCPIARLLATISTQGAEVGRLKGEIQAGIQVADTYEAPGPMLHDKVLWLGNQMDALRAEIDRKNEEIAGLTKEAHWIREKVGLSVDTPFLSGSGPTLAGKMHVLCSEAHGYDTYIVAFKCDDKQGLIARQTVTISRKDDQLRAAAKMFREEAENCRQGVADCREIGCFVNRAAGYFGCALCQSNITKANQNAEAARQCEEAIGE